MGKQPTCAERIQAQLDGRLESFDELMERASSDDDETREAADDEWFEYPLSVETRRTVVIQLSTGGPGDQFECDIDADGVVEEIRYRFLDWFDGAALTLRDTEYDRALAFCQPFVDYEPTSNA